MLCPRCHDDNDFEFPHPNGGRDACSNCGVRKGRPILSRNSMRRRKIGGKRGRNSGTTGTAKTKR